MSEGQDDLAKMVPAAVAEIPSMIVDALTASADQPADTVKLVPPETHVFGRGED